MKAIYSIILASLSIIGCMEKVNAPFDAVLSNSQNQELLFLKDDNVLNSVGQSLGHFEGNELFNLLDQKIASVDGNQILNLQGQVLGRVEDDQLINSQGQATLNVSGTTKLAKLKVAAFFFFV